MRSRPSAKSSALSSPLLSAQVAHHASLLIVGLPLNQPARRQSGYVDVPMIAATSTGR
jgi:hypothetical protein